VLRYSKYNAGKKVSAQDKYMCKFARKHRMSRFRGMLVFDGMAHSSTTDMILS
jgi:hypothetical protein